MWTDIAEPPSTFLQSYFSFIVSTYSPFSADYFTFVCALCVCKWTTKHPVKWSCGNRVVKGGLSNVMDLLNLLRAPC